MTWREKVAQYVPPARYVKTAQHIKLTEHLRPRAIPTPIAYRVGGVKIAAQHSNLQRMTLRVISSASTPQYDWTAGVDEGGLKAMHWSKSTII